MSADSGRFAKEGGRGRGDDITPPDTDDDRRMKSIEARELIRKAVEESLKSDDPETNEYPLCGRDFHGLDLQDLNLFDTDLSGADLSGAI